MACQEKNSISLSLCVCVRLYKSLCFCVCLCVCVWVHKCILAFCDSRKEIGSTETRWERLQQAHRDCLRLYNRAHTCLTLKFSRLSLRAVIQGCHPGLSHRCSHTGLWHRVFTESHPGLSHRNLTQDSHLGPLHRVLIQNSFARLSHGASSVLSEATYILVIRISYPEGNKILDQQMMSMA